ncbi:ribosome maturation factor RimM [Aestuariispira insulae]|uniref:Ribosome maturation factor RimM n=1 Tax=Aestuariispira insulae TaxID=1461337 RepID=A0A3D9HHW8_9PROT|nr:ribosome maturation factor RimM [Aestuariispira insulae]RED49132.1 16S rRNA processing protein RimM [Aestuariispira insulae]
MKNQLCLGVITGAHGIRGQVRVKSFTEAPEQLTAYGPLSDESGEQTFKLKITGQSKGSLIVSIKGINDRNLAEDLKGTELYIDRDKLPAANTEDDEFYHADLIGLKAETVEGAGYGTIKAVHNFGAGDILDINLIDGGAEMLPFDKETVLEVDLENGRLVINPPVMVVASEDAESQGEAS